MVEGEKGGRNMKCWVRICTEEGGRGVLTGNLYSVVSVVLVYTASYSAVGGSGLEQKRYSILVYRSIEINQNQKNF